MPSIKQLSRTLDQYKNVKSINWHPGHMFSGMQAMIGKLNTVDCVVEVHDARIPFTGRNKELRRQLGTIKPRVLVLNKSDLADLNRWESIKARLAREGDENVVLTDFSGSTFSFKTRGYQNLMQEVVNVINSSDRHNRQTMEFFKIMIVGIPNVGKSTLINRLRQHHLGKKGEPARVGRSAGVTKHVEQMIKVCARPTVYSLDTPGVLMPDMTKNHDQAMRLALCSNISDIALDPLETAKYLLNYLNETENTEYTQLFQIKTKVASCIEEIVYAALSNDEMTHKIRCKDSNVFVHKPDVDKICWRFINAFREGRLGKVMFD